MWWSLVYVLVVILNIINILFTDYCRMFSLQKNPACACEDDYKVIYLRVLFGFEMSEVHLQILLSCGLTAGPSGVAAQAKGEVLALV